MASLASLDLVRLCQFQVVLSAFSLVGTAPAYNLPILLYGLFGLDDTTHLSNFIALLTLSELLDILWLFHNRGTYGTWSALLIVAGMAAKPVTLLAAQSQLSNRGQPAFPGLGDSNSQTIFSAVPGAFNSRPQAQSNSSYQQGFFAEEDEEASVEGTSDDKPKTNPGYQSM